LRLDGDQAGQAFHVEAGVQPCGDQHVDRPEPWTLVGVDTVIGGIAERRHGWERVGGQERLDVLTAVVGGELTSRVPRQ
jgi:hypothetical protein